MHKQSLPGKAALWPVPAVLVTVGSFDGQKNVLTISWTGTVCSAPPMVSVSIRPERFSHALASRSFVINVPGPDVLEAVDVCGTLSGRDVDKFERAGLTPVRAEAVEAPLIAECPLNLECLVRQVIPLGSHDLFLAEVVRVHLADGFEADLRGVPVYGFGRYHLLAESPQPHGFSLRKG